MSSALLEKLKKSGFWPKIVPGSVFFSFMHGFVVNYSYWHKFNNKLMEKKISGAW